MSPYKRLNSTVAVVAVAAALTACAAQPYSSGPVGGAAPAYPSQQSYAQLGRVTNVEFMRANQSSGLGGAVVGGAVGGLAGNQIGGGTGRTVATVAGVIGGALVGRHLEQNMNRNNVDHYRVTVQLDAGGVRTFDYAEPPNVRIGDRVSAQGDQLYR
ncbi:MAG: glycine zipper 2TM domain-containing protein [Proteobacteria bacterium]|jgi:outer membrane lipoprotein SlyB|nr:glycine zipper 2TM domain-containing protein [Pseudomonadota bacterium]